MRVMIRVEEDHIAELQWLTRGLPACDRNELFHERTREGLDAGTGQGPDPRRR